MVLCGDLLLPFLISIPANTLYLLALTHSPSLLIKFQFWIKWDLLSRSIPSPFPIVNLNFQNSTLTSPKLANHYKPKTTSAPPKSKMKNMIEYSTFITLKQNLKTFLGSTPCVHLLLLPHKEKFSCSSPHLSNNCLEMKL